MNEIDNGRLLTELHANLWESLRHTFNTDRVLLAVTYLVNFTSFILMLVLLPGQIAASVIAIVCIAAVNTLIFFSINNSKNEIQHITLTLEMIYADHGMAKYFDLRQFNYYRQRYRLWQILVPVLAVSAIIVAAAIKLIT